MGKMTKNDDIEYAPEHISHYQMARARDALSCWESFLAELKEKKLQVKLMDGKVLIIDSVTDEAVFWQCAEWLYYKE